LQDTLYRQSIDTSVEYLYVRNINNTYQFGASSGQLYQIQCRSTGGHLVVAYDVTTSGGELFGLNLWRSCTDNDDAGGEAVSIGAEWRRAGLNQLCLQSSRLVACRSQCEYDSGQHMLVTTPDTSVILQIEEVWHADGHEADAVSCLRHYQVVCLTRLLAWLAPQVVLLIIGRYSLEMGGWLCDSK
jgi:hypothetical protein